MKTEILDAVFDVVEDNTIPQEKSLAIQNHKSKEVALSVKVTEDYNTARDNLNSIVKDGMALVPDALEFAKDSQSPRSYESVSTFIKTLAELNKMLAELSMGQLKESSEKGKGIDNAGGTVNNTAVFVGTSEDVLDKILNKLDGQKG